MAMIPAAGKHGGDATAVERALRLRPGRLVDLSVSLNPFAPDVAPLVARHADAGARYPDPQLATEALAEALGAPPEAVLLTAGGAEAIELAATALGGGRVVEPDFALYPRGGGPLFASDPRNPTGERVEATGAAVVDEAFLPLVTGTWRSPRLDDALAGRVLMVGSLTKVFACPGLRLGYALGDVEALRKLQRPWSVSSLALAVLPDLLETAHLDEWAARLSELRARLVEEAPWPAEPGVAPYVTFGVGDGAAVRAALVEEHSVLVRDCASFGLPDRIRVAVHPDAPWLRKPKRARRAPRRVERAAVLMVAGTASDVGKTHVVTGLCRALARRGVKVAPFKAQNMANNSFVTADGLEIGRAQGVQALAAGLEPEVDMNPILLKPTGDRTSQVVVRGRAVGHMSAAEYHELKPSLFGEVTAALDRLRDRFEVVVVEGAGSAAEINLYDADIVNMRVAAHASAPVLLVGDIDRGGVFASFYGTWALLPPEHRHLLRGFLVNKFRGDASLLAGGFSQLEDLTGVPTVGVVPWVDGLALDAEDSLALDGPRPRAAEPAAAPQGDPLDVAALRFPRISNFTDLDALALEPGVGVRLVDGSAALGDPDLIVLPGTKSTMADLAWLRATGLDRAVVEAAGRGTPVIGICGGYQMLGRRILDPEHVESSLHQLDGLGLLPVDTTFVPTKTVRRSTLVVDAGPGRGLRVSGYEIHHGQGGPPVVAEGPVVGTQLHGLLEDDAYRRALLTWAAGVRGRHFVPASVDFAAARQHQMDRLADLLEDHCDLKEVLGWLECS